MQRQSLLDGDDFSGIGGRGGSGGGGGGGGGSMDKAKLIKLSVAGVLFVAAAVLLAINFGVINLGGGGDEFKAKPVSAEKQREREEQTKKDQEEIERMERSGEATIGGA